VDEVSRVGVLDSRDLERVEEGRGGRGGEGQRARRGKKKGRKRKERTSWSARRRTVLRENFLLQKLKRSSKLGPRRSITIAL